MIYFLLILSVYSTPEFFTWSFYNQNTDCAAANFTNLWFIPIMESGSDYVGCTTEEYGYRTAGNDIAIYYESSTTYGEKEDCSSCGDGNYCPSDDFTIADASYGSCHDNFWDYEGVDMSRKVELLQDQETVVVPDDWLLEITYQIFGGCENEISICQEYPVKPIEYSEYDVYVKAAIYKPDGNCQDVTGLDTCTFVDFCQSRYRACGDGSLVYPFYSGDDGDDGDDGDGDDDDLGDENGGVTYSFALDAFFYIMSLYML